MISSEFSILISAGCGAAITLLVAIINNRHQLKQAHINNQEKYNIELLKFKNGKKKEHTNHLLNKLEKTHQILSKISLENSLTVNYITSSPHDLDIQKFHERYLTNCKELSEARMIVDLYFPEIHSEIEKIPGLSNCFWGDQQNLMYQYQNKNNEAVQHVIPEIVQTSNEIEKTITYIKSLISDISQKLNKDLL